MYCYEDKITDELIEVMASEEKICHYIDIPLQHISDHVLSSMNRHSTTESIKDTLCRLRKAIPDIHIRTTLITGFPGEGEEDFDELVDFVESQKFERLGVFAYSREEGTVAGDMENQIDEEIEAGPGGQHHAQADGYFPRSQRGKSGTHFRGPGGRTG